MHGETSDAAKRRVERVAELAAGSGDETPEAPPGYPWPHLPSPVEPGTQPDLRPKSDSCPDFWPDGRHLDPPTEACDCDHPAPVQPPAPDPDKTFSESLMALNYRTCPRCGEHKFIGHGPLCSGCYTAPAPPATTEPDRHDRGCAAGICSSARCQCAPPATTGPAGEAEGLLEHHLADLLDATISAAHDQAGGGFIDVTAVQRHVIDTYLAARDAAQQRIGAEKAWDEAHETVCESDFHICDEYHNNPYRADRIAPEGQA